MELLVFNIDNIIDFHKIWYLTYKILDICNSDGLIFIDLTFQVMKDLSALYTQF